MHFVDQVDDAFAGSHRLADLFHGHLQEPESRCVPVASKQPRRLDRPDEGSVWS
jgi:hypothetical protein